MRVVVVGDAGDADDGYVGEHLDALGASVRPVCRDDPGALEGCAAGADLLVLLGSDRSVYDPASSKVVEVEAALVVEAERRGVPVFGICYGGQLLAHALGGSVAPAQRAEIGWRSVLSSSPDLISSGPWFELHFDAFTPPPGAALLAFTKDSAQAFSLGRCLGVQFHPEVTPTTAASWLRAGRARLEAEGLVIEEIEEQCRRGGPRARRACATLVDAFLAANL